MFPATYEDLLAMMVPCMKACQDFINRYELVASVVPDHICYKCGSPEEYDRMRAMLEKDVISAWFFQKHISGRMVGYAELRTKIPFMRHTIGYVELQENKPSEVPGLGGIHHMEFYPGMLAYPGLMSSLQATGEKVEIKPRPHHTTCDVTLKEGFILRLADAPLIVTIASRDLFHK